VRLRTQRRLTTAAEINRDWLSAIIRRLTRRLTQTEQRLHGLEGILLHTSGSRETPFHVAVVQTPAGPAATLTNLAVTQLEDYLETLVADAQFLPALRALLAEPDGLVLLVGPERQEKQQFCGPIANQGIVGQADCRAGPPAAPARAGLDAGASGRQPPEDLLAGLDAALALSPDLLVAAEAMDPLLLRTLLIESLGTRSIIGALRLSTLWSALEYLLERVESRVLLCEGLRGLICFTMIRLLPEAAKEPDDRYEMAARVLGIPLARARAGRLLRERQAAGEAEGEWQPLVSVLPLTAATLAMIKSDNPPADIVETIRKTVEREMTAGLRESVLNGEITLDEYMTVVGSDNHASA
jgi:type II secretory ATPase GspE/PulE/Tfp pilus assembly ATPase PilB-like protein